MKKIKEKTIKIKETEIFCDICGKKFNNAIITHFPTIKRIDRVNMEANTFTETVNITLEITPDKTINRDICFDCFVKSFNIFINNL